MPVKNPKFAVGERVWYPGHKQWCVIGSHTIQYGGIVYNLVDVDNIVKVVAYRVPEWAVHADVIGADTDTKKNYDRAMQGI